MTRTIETTTQAGSSAIGQRIYLDRDQCEAMGIGQRIYLDRDQCEAMGVSYDDDGGDLVASAEAILRSRAQGYDRDHIDTLAPLGGATIMAKPTGYGWFEITRVI